MNAQVFEFRSLAKSSPIAFYLDAVSAKVTTTDLTGLNKRALIDKEDPEKLTIQSGPADSLIQTINKSEIQQRHPQSSSPMPLLRTRRDSAICGPWS